LGKLGWLGYRSSEGHGYTSLITQQYFACLHCTSRYQETTLGHHKDVLQALKLLNTRMDSARWQGVIVLHHIDVSYLSLLPSPHLHEPLYVSTPFQTPQPGVGAHHLEHALIS
jgi:hypothetical protein